MRIVIKNEEKLIDVVKVFFSICIVALHTDLFSYLSNDVTYFYIKQVVLRMSVPFFLFTSFVYLAKKLLMKHTVIEKVKVVDRYIYGLLRYYIIFVPIYSVIYFLQLNFFWKCKEPIVMNLLRVFRSILVYPQGAMWFMYACIIVGIILKIYYKCNLKLNKRIVIIIAILFYSFALISNTYYFIILDTLVQKIVDIYLELFISARNGIFYGIPMFILAYFYNRFILKYKKENHIYIKKIIFGISILVLIFEVIITKNYIHADDYALYISNLFFSMIIYDLVKNLDINFKYKEINWIYFRQLSTWIYLTHGIFRYMLLWINFTGINYALLTLILTILLSVGILRRKKVRVFINKIE